MARRAVGVTALLLLVLACGACAKTPTAQSVDTVAQSDTSPPSAAAPTEEEPQSTPATAASEIIDDDTGQPVQTQAVAQWDEESREAVIEAATTAMTLFARPHVDHDTWWSDLEPLLTDQARADYAYVDPAVIPAHTVGQARLVDESSAYVAAVEVDTDVGAYTVTLIRQTGDSPWLASRFTPPEGVR